MKSKLWEKHVDKVADRIIRILDSDSRGDEIYQCVKYTLRVVVGETEKLILLFLIFVLMNHGKEFMVAFLTLVSLRCFTGGTHRESMLGCFLQSVCIFEVIIVSSHLFWNEYEWWILTVIELLLIVIFVPIQSPKRMNYNFQQKNKLKKRTAIVIIIHSLVYICMLNEVKVLMTNALLFHAMELLIAGILIHRKEERNQ